MGQAMGSHHSARAKTCVWLTPPPLLEALGPFDLDPCACSEPRPWPTAEQHYTAEDDGLSQPWRGRVWLNPPYGPPPIINPWLAKMAQHNSGTALIFARTETEGWHKYVWPKASAILFLRGRLYFHFPNGEQAEANAGAPSALVAYGPVDKIRLTDAELPGQLVELR